MIDSGHLLELNQLLQEDVFWSAGPSELEHMKDMYKNYIIVYTYVYRYKEL